MKSRGVFILAPILWALTIATEEITKSSTAVTKTTLKHENGSIANSRNSTPTKSGGTLTSFNVDSSMIQRALYVLIGITIIGVLYFLVRAVRLKKTTTQRKKYGLLSNYDENMEMAALDSDEDMTVYEAKTLRR